MKYVKRPIPVDAVQWFDGDHPALSSGRDLRGNERMFIATREGRLAVTPGCWIMGPGVEGEYWAVQDSIFQKSYMPAPEFAREERYVVVKIKHLRAVGQENAMREWLRNYQVQTVDCVVVESDWPEYEPTWAAIQARVVGETGDDHGTR